MVTIFNERAIKIAWTIYKGVSAVKENFDRANVVVFLIDHRGNKINVGCRQEMGTLYVDIPAGALHEGIYSIEAIWAKNRDFTRPHSWEMAPWVLNHTFMDSRNIVRCLKEDLFAVTEYIREQAGVFPDEGTVVVKAKSSAATYGYDGLDAYEMSVVLGYTTLSRDEWLSQINVPTEAIAELKRYILEICELNGLKVPNAKKYSVTTNGEHCIITGEEEAEEFQSYEVSVTPHAGYEISSVWVKIGNGDTIKDIFNDDTGTITDVSLEGDTITFTITSVTGDLVITGNTMVKELELSFEDGENGEYQWEDEEGQSLTSCDTNVEAFPVAYIRLADGYSFMNVYCETSATLEYANTTEADGRIKVTFRNLTSSLMVKVKVNADTIFVSTESANWGGLSVDIKYDGESVYSTLDFSQGIIKGSNFSLKLTPTANYYKVTDPAYKIGDGNFTTITPSEGSYYIEVTNIQNNIVLKGKFANETRRFYGLCNMSDDMSLINLDNATPIPSGGVTGLSTDATHNTFFVAYQGSAFPTMSTMGISFSSDTGTITEVNYHEKTYNVWRYTNEYGATYSDISIN